MSGISTANGGTIHYRNYQGGVGYSIYVPANVNADTPIFTYTYGGGRTADWWSRKHSNGNYGPYDGLIANGGDSIVIMPTMDWGADWGANTMGIINSVREEYGITNLTVSGSGFSKGGFGGFDAVAANLKQNPDIDPQVVFFIDDYSSTYYMANHKLTAEKAQLFVENDTVFFTYDPPWKSTDNYKTYLDAGINMIRVEPTNYDHIAINANFFKNAIYDYMAGGSLPTEGYTYKRAVVTVDPVTGEKTVSWETIPAELITTKDKLYDYYGFTTKEEANKNFFDKIVDYFGEKISILHGFNSSGSRLAVNPSEVEQACNYLRNDACVQLEDMLRAVDEAYQAVVEYAASSPYPVSVPSGFDKSGAVSAINKATQECNEAATKVYNIADVINCYSSGKWSLSNGTISKLVNFIGFVVMPDKTKSDDNNRFKFL